MKQRELKFRVWDNVDYMSKPFTLHSLMNADRIEFTSDCKVMQYTGLKDKNGKEVYEGDITECSLHGRTIVEMRGGQFGIVGGDPKGFRSGEAFNYYPHNHTVIGNIYENPELLSCGN